MQTLTLYSIVPPEFPDGLKFVRWQTWPFDTDRPGSIWSEGVCERDDFLEIIRPALHTIGQPVYWKEFKLYGDLS